MCMCININQIIYWIHMHTYIVSHLHWFDMSDDLTSLIFCLVSGIRAWSASYFAQLTCLYMWKLWSHYLLVKLYVHVWVRLNMWILLCPRALCMDWKTFEYIGVMKYTCLTYRDLLFPFSYKDVLVSCCYVIIWRKQGTTSRSLWNIKTYFGE